MQSHLLQPLYVFLCGSVNTNLHTGQQEVAQEAAAATRSARCVWVLLHISLIGALLSAHSNLGASLLGSATVSSFFVLLVTEIALFAALCCSNPGTCKPRPRTWSPHGSSSMPDPEEAGGARQAAGLKAASPWSGRDTLQDTDVEDPNSPQALASACAAAACSQRPEERVRSGLRCSDASAASVQLGEDGCHSSPGHVSRGYVSSWAGALAAAAAAPPAVGFLPDPDPGPSQVLDVRSSWCEEPVAGADLPDGLAWGGGGYLTAGGPATTRRGMPAGGPQTAPSLADWLRPLIAQRLTGLPMPAAAQVSGVWSASGTASADSPAPVPHPSAPARGGARGPAAPGKIDAPASPRISVGWGPKVSPPRSPAARTGAGEAALACAAAGKPVGLGRAGCVARGAAGAWWLRACPGRWCEACGAWQPLRARHCAACQRCVLAFDHHCTWAGVCIGARNRRLFLAYLGAATALLAWTLAAAAGGAARSLGRLEGGSVLGADPMLLAAALASAALLLPVWLVATAQTTWEHAQRGRVVYLRHLPEDARPFSGGLVADCVTFLTGNLDQVWEM